MRMQSFTHVGRHAGCLREVAFDQEAPVSIAVAPELGEHGNPVSRLGTPQEGGVVAVVVIVVIW